MRRGLTLLLLGCLVAIAWADCDSSSSSSSSSSEEDEDSHGGYHGRGYMGQRVDDSAFRLERLEARLKAIKARLDDDHGIDHSLDVIAALESHEGGNCPDGEFHCGSNSMCVSTLLVCDGTEDCPNGDDESADRCKNRAKAGEYFEGGIHWDGCKANADSVMTIKIIGNKEYNYFPARVWLDARTTFDYGNDAHSYDSSGYLDYGTNGFELHAHGEHVDASCHFVSDDVVDCEMHSNAGIHCADVRLTRHH